MNIQVEVGVLAPRERDFELVYAWNVVYMNVDVNVRYAMDVRALVFSDPAAKCDATCCDQDAN